MPLHSIRVLGASADGKTPGTLLDRLVRQIV